MVACEWRARWDRHEKAAATTQTVATARASARRDGPGRVFSPRSPTGTNDGQGRGVGTRRTTRPSSRRTHPQEPGTRYHDLDDVSVPELGGSRPDRFFAVSGPQERVQRHTVEQMADSAPVLPMLDALVPLMVEQPVQVLKFLDISFPDVEQLVEVPKIFSDVIPSRSSVSEPQLAEQLVEVPTDRVYALDIIAVRNLWNGSSSGTEQTATERHRQARAGYKYWPPRRWLTLPFHGPCFWQSIVRCVA